MQFGWKLVTRYVGDRREVDWSVVEGWTLVISPFWLEVGRSSIGGWLEVVSRLVEVGSRFDRVGGTAVAS